MTDVITSCLNYVVVELLPTSRTISETMEKGLFRGIKRQVCGKSYVDVILLGKHNEKDTVYGFIHDFYRVLSIKIGCENISELVVFNNTDSDQKQAIEILNALLDTAREEKKTFSNDPMIIDLDKYTNLPYNLLEPEKYSAYGQTSTNEEWRRVPVATAYCQTINQNKEEQEKLRYTPQIIKRAGALPSEEMMKAMRRKVKSLQRAT